MIGDFLEEEYLEEDNVPLDENFLAELPIKKEKFTNETCPISRTLNLLSRTGAGSSHSHTDALVIVGGEEIVMDSAEYYASVDAIEMSLLEAKYTHAPSDEQKEAIVRTKSRIFAEFADGDLYDAYDRLFKRVLPNSYLLAEQLSRTIVLLNIICMRLEMNGTIIKPFNTEINTYVVIRRPDVLANILSKICEYVLRINKQVHLSEESLKNIQPPKFDYPTFPTNVAIITANTMEGIKELFNQKKMVIDYMVEVEKIHTIVIKFLESLIGDLMKVSRRII